MCALLLLVISFPLSLQMCINRYKAFARFGLMHMAATNICVWLRAIVVETLHEIQVANRNVNTSSPYVLSSAEKHAVAQAQLDSINVGKPCMLRGRYVYRNAAVSLESSRPSRH